MFEVGTMSTASENTVLRVLFPWRGAFARLSLGRHCGHRLAVVASFNALVWVLGFSWGVAFTSLQPVRSVMPEIHTAVLKQWLWSIGICMVAMLGFSYLLQALYRSLLYVVYGAI
jgi:hypothetical protein